jgi:ferritin-like metal-binding protein YciE
MEREAEDMLTAQSKRTENFPQLKSRIDQHIGETRTQQKRVEESLDELGESPSLLKDAAMRIAGNAQTLFNAMAQDEVIKNTLVDYGFENFEMASYKGLITLAELAGTPRIASRSRESLEEERRMAAWLDDHLPEIVAAHAQRTERGETSHAGVA